MPTKGTIGILAGTVAIAVVLGSCATGPDGADEAAAPARPEISAVPRTTTTPTVHTTTTGHTTTTVPTATTVPTPATTTASAAVAGFPRGAAVDYQLGGDYPVPDGVGIVVRDSTGRPAPGIWSVCYVNGFQTQEGEERRWSGDRAELILHDGAGRQVADPDWPEERLLDTGTAAKRRAIAAVVSRDLRRCADRGFDAVEVDNLDSFTRAPGGRLTVDDNLALAVLYARQAHDLGLQIAQKNAAEFAGRLRREVGFDFAVAEECISYQECRAYTDVYGDAVIDIEYSDDPRVTLRRICADPSRPRSTVLRDRELVRIGHQDYVYRRCASSSRSLGSVRSSG